MKKGGGKKKGGRKGMSYVLAILFVLFSGRAFAQQTVGQGPPGDATTPWFVSVNYPKTNTYSVVLDVLNEELVIDLGMTASQLSFQSDVSYFIGTATYRGSFDGANWFTVPVICLSQCNSPGAYFGQDSQAYVGSLYSQYHTAQVAGLRYFRIKATAYTSGTLTVTAQVSDAPGNPGRNQVQISGPGAIGAAGVAEVSVKRLHTVPVTSNGSEQSSTITITDNLIQPAYLFNQLTFPLLFDGTNWDRAPGTSTDGALVNLGANNDVTVTGTVDVNCTNGCNSPNIVDSGNSSTATLTSGATFTGASIEVLPYAVSAVNSVTDKASTIYLEWSSDNSNWDISESYILAAGEVFSINASPRARYFRVRLTNTDKTNQTYLRLQTLLSLTDNAVRKSAVGDAPATNDPAQLVKSAIYGTTTAGGGGFVGVKVAPSGALQVNGGDWLTDAQLRASAVPISAASLPLPTGAATAAIQTDGTQKTQIVDSGGAVVNATGTSLDVNCTGGCGGAGSFLDNATFTFGTTPVGVMGAVVDDTAPNAVSEDSAGAPRMSTNRNLYSTIRDASGQELGANVVDVSVMPTISDDTALVVGLRETGLNGLAGTGTFIYGGGRDGSFTSRQFVMTNSAPSSEYGLVVRNVPSGTQAVSAVSLPLPTGAATAANQLPDGHNVTVDNAAGAAAVNIQDGGNTITVDGTVAATQSGAWTVAGTGTFTVSDPSFTDATGTAVPANVAVVGGSDTFSVTRPIAVDTNGRILLSSQQPPQVTPTSGSGGTAFTAAAQTLMFGPSVGSTVVDFRGTFTGFTATLEVSIDVGTTWQYIEVWKMPSGTVQTGTVSVADSTTEYYVIPQVPLGAYIRITAATLTSGTVNINYATNAWQMSGRKVEAVQSGTYTVQPGNTPNTTPWLVKEQRAATPAVTSVAGSASNVTCLASNANRLGATIYNDSSADLYVKLGATASSSSFTVKLFQDGFFTVPFGYTGIIDCIWSSATGNARVTEVTQ